MEGLGDNIHDLLCRGLYKEEDDYLVPWSGTDPDTNMNGFIWSKEENLLDLPRGSLQRRVQELARTYS